MGPGGGGGGGVADTELEFYKMKLCAQMVVMVTERVNDLTGHVNTTEMVDTCYLMAHYHNNKGKRHFLREGSPPPGQPLPFFPDIHNLRS